MRRFIAIALVSLALTLAASCSKGPGGESGGPYVQAMKAVEAYNFNLADSLLAGLAKSDSSGYLTTYGQAVSDEHQLMLCDALGNYLLTVSRYPDSAAALAGLTRMFTLLESPDEAAEAARRWSEAEKGNNQARLRLIRSQIDAGMYPKAEKSLEEARKVGLDKSVGDLLQARLQVISKQYDDASKTATQAITQASESPDFLLALADYYDERGQVDSAVLAGSKSYEVSQELFYGYVNFRRCLKHQYFTAARAFIAELAREDKSNISVTAAKLQYKVKAEERVLLSKVADQLEASRANNYTTQFLCLAARESIGDIAFADTHQGIIDDYVSRIGAYPPFKAFLRWNIFHPDYKFWPYSPIDVMKQLDSLRGWRETLPRFQAMAAGGFLADTTRARFNARVDSLITANAGNAPWLTKLGLTFSESVGLGHEIGNRAFQTVLQKDPQFVPARVALIDNAVIDRKWVDALSEIAADPALGDKNPETGVQKALCEAKLGKGADAVESFAKSYPLVKGEVARAEVIALELIRQADGNHAQQIVTQCTDLLPKDADACRLASDVQFRLGNYQASLDQAEKGLKLEPEYSGLNSLKARAMYALGQKDESKKLFAEILKKSPNDPDACQMFSRILADENLEPDRAQNLARQAQVSGKIVSRPTINLAYVYIKGGRYDLAWGAANHASIIYPDDPEAFYYLGMASFYGKRAGAKEDLQKAISFGLKGDELQTARETLNKI